MRKGHRSHIPDAERQVQEKKCAPKSGAPFFEVISGMDHVRAKNRRAFLLDEIRGADILVMVCYHGTYDLVYLFGVDFPTFHSIGFHLLQQAIAWVFIILSGISCRYSRNNLRRGVKCFGCGVLVSLVTILFLPGQAIWFGILHFMGAAMLLFALLRPLLDRLPPLAGIIVNLFLLLLTWEVPHSRLGLPGLPGLPLPRLDSPWLLPLGFGGAGSDYFPILPWIFLFFAGTYLGVYVRQERMPKAVYRLHIPWLAKLGRHTMIVYLLHQPVLYGVLTLLFLLIRA